MRDTHGDLDKALAEAFPSARAVFEGAKAFGGPMRYVLAGSGHIAGVVNPPAKGKYQYWTGGKPEGDIETWIKKATEHPGSW